MVKLDIGGETITDCLAKLTLTPERGFAHIGSFERDAARKTKEQAAYIALDYRRELSQCNEHDTTAAADQASIELPDGSKVPVSSERFQCAEVLFQPSIDGIDGHGLHDGILQAIAKCDPASHPDLFANIALAGSTSLLPGLAERLRSELADRAPQTAAVRVLASPDRQNAAWLGAGIFAAELDMGSKWVTKDEYDEVGPSIVHQKCFHLG